ncbi:MAG: GTP pyrophosphokinase family protein [Lachnospiraceae bacterium]|nr:GTP pyrophosphokinase family protein [Lachnospiraceae bacterium]
MIDKQKTLWNTSAEIAQRLKVTLDDYRRLMTYFNCAMMEVETKFKVLNSQFSMSREYNPIETIKTRLKAPESIMEKLQRKGLPMEAASIENNLYDIAGVRVICPFIDDIYLISDCLLAQDDVKLIEKKDYIKNPKGNGYRSLHLIIEVPIFLYNEKRAMKVEVQLRTIAMDFWASLEHRLRYKKNLDEELAGALASELKYCAETSAELDLRMEKIKNEIQNAKDED